MYSGKTELDLALEVEEASEAKEDLGIIVRLTPQIDFGNKSRSFVSSLSRAWATPESEGGLAAVSKIVESFGAA